MTRRKGSLDVTAVERERIRALYRAGVRILDIIAATGRCESVVYRTVRGLRRRRPPPPSGKHAARNDRILKFVEKGMSRAPVGRRFGLSPSQVSTIVAEHPLLAELLLVKRVRPAEVARRFRLELSTALRIAGRGAKVERTWRGAWNDL